MPRLVIVRAISAIMILAATSAAQTSTQPNFKNFNYPFAESTEWPHELQWLDTEVTMRVDLKNGRVPISAEDSGSDAPFRGLTLESVRYADVTGDGKTDAIVVLRFDTGGTQYSHYVYVYSVTAHRPKLLAYFHSGDRANHGLYRVYGQGGKLVVELFDPDKQQGDCCSSGFVRSRFKWTGRRFVNVGTQEHGAVKVTSRLPVDVFGRHP